MTFKLNIIVLIYEGECYRCMLLSTIYTLHCSHKQKKTRAVRSVCPFHNWVNTIQRARATVTIAVAYRPTGSQLTEAVNELPN